MFTFQFCRASGQGLVLGAQLWVRRRLHRSVMCVEVLPASFLSLGYNPVSLRGSGRGTQEYLGSRPIGSKALPPSHPALPASTGPTLGSAPSCAPSAGRASPAPRLSPATSASTQHRSPTAARLAARASHSSAPTRATSARTPGRSPSCARAAAACSPIPPASGATSAHMRA